MSFSEKISPFFGRCTLVWFYMSGAMNILNDWQHISGAMAAKHVPLPPVVLLIVLLFIVMGSISLLFGYQTRHGAVLLFGMTIIAAVVMHDFWHIADPGQRYLDFQIFARDVAIAGGLLMIVGMGAGPFAIDNAGSGGGKSGGGKRR